MIKKDGKFGLVKSDGTLQLTVIYDFIDFDMAVDDGFGDIILNGKYGFIDNEGNIKSRRWYDEISLDYLQYYDMAPVRKDGKYGIVDKEGKIVFPVIFDYMPDIETIIERSSAIFLRSNSKFGVYSVEGEELVAPKYDWITDEGGDFVNYFLIENDKKRGLLDKNFVEIVPCKYAHIDILSLERGEEFAVVSLNEKMGLIDKYGKEILPCEYNHLEVISSEDEGIIEVYSKERTYQINKFGKEINSTE